MTTWLEILQERVDSMTQVKLPLVIALRRRCRPFAYAAIAVGTVWTASSAPAIFDGSEAAHHVANLRIASSILVGGLLLAALAHWDESVGGEPIDNAGDQQ